MLHPGGPPEAHGLDPFGSWGSIDSDGNAAKRVAGCAARGKEVVWLSSSSE
jgi:hypothetical protein